QRAVAVRQALERVAERVRALCPREIEPRLRSRAAVEFEPCFRTPPLPPAVIVAEIARNGEYPGTKCFPGTKVVTRTVDVQKRFLHQILGFALALAPAREEAQQYRPVRAEQISKGLLVACHITRHQVCFAIAHTESLVARAVRIVD